MNSKFVLPLFVICLLGPTSRAQEIQRLVEYTNVWTFDQSGASLGTAWKEPAFDDSAWLSGRGLLGVETNLPPPYPVPLNTPLALGSPPTVTYYFRTRFVLPDVPPGIAYLKANVYADDGCVIYLNGREAARARIGPNQHFQTLSGFAVYEGFNDVFYLDPALLKTGENVLAAEVHQNSANSSDVVWGMSLKAIVATPIAVVQQPTNSVVLLGQTNTFAVETTGGPGRYQWFFNDVAVTNATNQSLTLANLKADASGTYFVTISNYFGRQVSEPALLTVLPVSIGGPLDYTGPKLLAAFPANTPFSTSLDLVFSEALEPSSIATARVQVQMLTNGTPVTVSNVLIAGATARIRLSPENWFPDGSRGYSVTVSGFRDRSPQKNFCPPNSRLSVSFLNFVNLVTTNAEWNYHAFALQDPSILEAEWWRTDFVLSPDWKAAMGPFYVAGFEYGSCAPSLQTEIPFQYHPILFRTTFDWNGPTMPVTLNLRHLAFDGLVVYLNGREILRDNLPLAPVELTADSRTLNGRSGSGVPCIETNLPDVWVRSGTNLLACGVYQFRDGQASLDPGSAIFSLTARIADQMPYPLPPEARPRLDAAPGPNQAASFSWVGSGYALEKTTNLNLGVESYPFGPWIEVPNMSNPYTNQPGGAEQFFRLKK